MLFISNLDAKESKAGCIEKCGFSMARDPTHSGQNEKIERTVPFPKGSA
jgi:hypothetical protein